MNKQKVVKMIVKKESDLKEGLIIDFGGLVYYKLKATDKKGLFKLKFINKDTMKEIDKYAHGTYSFSSLKDRTIINQTFREMVMR